MGDATRFGIGDTVRIARREVPFSRTPPAVMGRVGRIVAVRGRFGEPERTSAGDVDAPDRVLYQVGIAIDESSELLVDLFEHWLEPATDRRTDPKPAPATGEARE